MNNLSSPVNSSLEWRRSKVQELASQGYSQREIAQMLQVELATVNRDISYLRNQAKINIRKYNQMRDTILFIPLQKR
jgi:transposase